MLFFEVDQDGFIRGQGSMSRRDAAINIRARDRDRAMFPGGLVIVPKAKGINADLHQMDWSNRTWVLKPEPEFDWVNARRGNMPGFGDQLGVLMKLAGYALAGEPVPAEVRSEFEALVARISEVKAEFPRNNE